MVDVVFPSGDQRSGTHYQLLYDCLLINRTLSNGNLKRLSSAGSHNSTSEDSHHKGSSTNVNYYYYYYCEEIIRQGESRELFTGVLGEERRGEESPEAYK